MKLLVSAIGLLSSCASLACVDISGFYGHDLAKGNGAVFHFAQTGCEKLSIGQLILEDGKVIHDIDSAAVYQNSATCQSDCALTFQANKDSLTLNYGGTVEVPYSGGMRDKYSCSYDSVDYSVTSQGNLKLNYNLNSWGPEDYCARATFAEEYKKTIDPRPQTSGSTGGEYSGYY